jgi:hypothetical protein
VAIHNNACSVSRVPIAIGGSVVRTIDQVDP